MAQERRLEIPTYIPMTERCNCVKGARLLNPTLPRIPSADALTPNTDAEVGAFALFNYHGIPHIGVVMYKDGIVPIIGSTNKRACQFTLEPLRPDDPSFRGFYKP